MKTKIADEFYDKFKSWEDINNIEDAAEKNYNKNTTSSLVIMAI